MVRKLASAVFLLVGIAIALGAYGHGFVGRLAVDAELAKVQIAPPIFKMLYVVWYFLSGCMLVFGATIILAWLKLRRGETALVPIVCLIGALYDLKAGADSPAACSNMAQCKFDLGGRAVVTCAAGTSCELKCQGGCAATCAAGVPCKVTCVDGSAGVTCPDGRVVCGTC